MDKDKSICFTGKLTKFTRDQARALAQEAGFVIYDSVNKFLDILVLADVNSTSAKAVKARKLNIRLMSEEEFLNECGKDLEEKHVQIKHIKEAADITWEKLLKKICHKLNCHVKIENIHYYENELKYGNQNFYSTGLNYNKDFWIISISDSKGICFCSNRVNGSYIGNVQNKEEQAKLTIMNLFSLKDNSFRSNIVNEIRGKLPIVTNFKSASAVKLSLEIAGWTNMA